MNKKKTISFIIPVWFEVAPLKKMTEEEARDYLHELLCQAIHEGSVSEEIIELIGVCDIITEDQFKQRGK